MSDTASTVSNQSRGVSSGAVQVTQVLLKDIYSLLKLRLSLAVAAAATAGFVLASGCVDGRTFLLFACVLSIAAGAGCLNNWQDQQLDAGMSRTRNRPLPAGRIPSPTALALACVLLIAGGTGLAAGPFHVAAAGVAAVAVLLYNGTYSRLKRRSSIALLPGVVCGSLPPLIGWLADGADVDQPAVWSLMVIFGLWQPPHFWLVVMAHEDDYLCGDVPSMLRVFSRAQLSRILFTWTAILGISLQTLPLTMGMTSPVLYAMELANALVLIGLCGWLLFKRTGTGVLFAALNISVFTGVLPVVAECLWGKL